MNCRYYSKVKKKKSGKKQSYVKLIRASKEEIMWFGRFSSSSFSINYFCFHSCDKNWDSLEINFTTNYQSLWHSALFGFNFLYQARR